MPPPPKSPTRLSGGTGDSPLRPIACSAPDERDVVDVVAGAIGPRALLAEAGHAADDQFRISGQQHVGADAEALDDAGRKPSISASALAASLSTTSRPAALFMSTAIDWRPRASTSNLRLAARHSQARIFAAVDANDAGAHVGEQHAGKRRRADAGHLDHGHIRERSHGDEFSLAGRATAERFRLERPGPIQPTPALTEQA